MKKYLFVLSAIVLFAFSSCKKFAGDPITQDFSIESNYTELEVQDAFEVTVSNAVDVITITAGENVMPKVIVEVVDNTLKIRIKPVANFYGGDLKALIPYNKNLKSVTLSGASEFHSEYGLEAQKVEVEMSGASDFYCDIDADEVDIEMSGASNFYGDVYADEIEMELSGSSNIKGSVESHDLDLEMKGASDATIEGQVSTLKINLSGASNITKTVNGTRYGFVCERCEGLMSGASDAYIHCDGTLKVDLSGSSELHFTGGGNPADCTHSGGSEVIHDVLP